MEENDKMNNPAGVDRAYCPVKLFTVLNFHTTEFCPTIHEGKHSLGSTPVRNV